MRRDGALGALGGVKSKSLNCTAELSDLVCYQQELSGARAAITGPLFSHNTRTDTHTHTQCVSLRPENFLSCLWIKPIS